MFRIFTIILSILGICLAVYVVSTAKEEIPAPPPAQPPSVNPYQNGIVALGLVEPAGRSISIAAPEPGRVVAVHVQVNDVVKQGDPLFDLDPVPLKAELMRAEAARLAAEADVTRLINWPRKEDLPPMEAEVAEARARLADAENRLESLEKAGKRGAASEDEQTRQRFLVSVQRSSLTNAEARLARMNAGSWEQDLAVARAALAAREADIGSIKLRLDRMTVRAPSGGTILKRNIEPGEYASSQNSADQEAPIMLGDLSAIHVRAQVDEEDAPLMTSGARAIARIRGSIDARADLEMVRIEPFARPKSQISGASTELIDTRVIEVVFAVKPDTKLPTIYPGQVVDVYIDASEAATRYDLPPRVVVVPQQP